MFLYKGIDVLLHLNGVTFKNINNLETIKIQNRNAWEA
jgi:hypothetical protein